MPSGAAGAAAPADGWVSAAETWTYASADNPTYTFTVAADVTSKYSLGMRVRLSQTTGGTKYGIITKLAYSAPNTTVTIYMGTDYSLANETISNPYYSIVKAPYGFPLDPSKWTVTFTDSTRRVQTPTINTWYNPGSPSLAVPIGCWNVEYRSWAYGEALIHCETALSTSSSSVSDSTLVGGIYAASTSAVAGMVTILAVLTLTAKTTYYAITRTQSSPGGGSTVGWLNDWSPMLIKATCAYL